MQGGTELSPGQFAGGDKLVANPEDPQALKKRREEERQREREEERRQEALESRREEERQRQREEERRQEALREQQEFENALEATHQRRENLLAQVRTQKRAERLEAFRQAQRQTAIMEALRLANRLQQRQADQAAGGETQRRAETRQARLDEQRQADQVAQRQGEARQARLDEQRQADRAAQREADQVAQRQAEARQARLDEQQQADQAAQRQANAQQTRINEQRQADQITRRRAAAQQARVEEQRQADQATQRQAAARQARFDEQRQAQIDEQRQADQAAQQKAETRQARLDEQRQVRLEEQRQADQAAQRRTEDQQARINEQRQADQAAQRQAAARQARLEEQRQVRLNEQRQADQAAQRQAAAGQDRLDEQRQARLEEQRRAVTRGELRQAPVNNPLEDPIPSGEISGSLPWLRVNFNRIANTASDPIMLRGISLLGPDSAEPDPNLGFAAGAGITEAAINAILDWGPNIIRLAINRNRVLNGYKGWTAADYLADLDGIIQQAAENGAYTLLSLRRLDETTVFGTLLEPGGEPEPNYIAPQPDLDAIGMWRLLGERYSNEPAVLFDLYTSPHAALPDDASGLHSNWDEWTLWVRLAVAELRQVHPRALCFVSGFNWATDVSGFPVTGTGDEPIPNLVYVTHLYPQQDNPLLAMRALARQHPVFVTEWGGRATDIGWSEQIALDLRASGIGWTAAHWNAEPPLVQARGQAIVPNLFGAVVRRELALTGEPLEATHPIYPNIIF